MRSHSSVAIVLSLALASAPLSARADDDDTVTVRTKSGDVYRGELVERVTGDHITIKLATGEIRTIAWADLATEPTARATAPTRASAPSTSTARGTFVHIDSTTSGLTLQRRTGAVAEGTASIPGTWATVTVESEVWQDVCAAPCDREVPSSRGGYRVYAPGEKPDDVDIAGARVDIHASLHGRGVDKLAAYTLGFGGFLAVVGTLTALVESTDHSNDIAYGGTTPTAGSSPSFGPKILAAAGVFVVLGIVIFVANKNSVSVDEHVGAATLPLGGGVALTPGGLVF
ncbi:MAG: hypothetical protein ACHREM_18625 [Polyangiales bacterium]